MLLCLFSFVCYSLLGTSYISIQTVQSIHFIQCWCFYIVHTAHAAQRKPPSIHQLFIVWWPVDLPREIVFVIFVFFFSLWFSMHYINLPPLVPVAGCWPSLYAYFVFLDDRGRNTFKLSNNIVGSTNSLDFFFRCLYWHSILCYWPKWISLDSQMQIGDFVICA